MKLHDTKVNPIDDGYSGSTTYNFVEPDDENKLCVTVHGQNDKSLLEVKSPTFAYEASIGELTDTLNRLRTTKHLAEFSTVLVNDIVNPLVSGLHLVAEDDVNCATRAIVNTNIAEALLPRTLTIVNPYEMTKTISDMMDGRSLFNDIDEDIRGEIETEITDILTGDSKLE